MLLRPLFIVGSIALLSSSLTGCAVVSVASAGVSVASTAVSVGVSAATTVAKGAATVGGAVIGAAVD
jgi:hypothetical protein